MPRTLHPRPVIRITPQTDDRSSEPTEAGMRASVELRVGHKFRSL